MLAVALGAGSVACSGQSAAATIVAPVSALATSSFGPTLNDYSIENTIDQSGLSFGYTSGVTDFGSYLASDPTHTSEADGNEWFSQNYGTNGISRLTVTYGFSELTSIDRFVLWNEEFAGIGKTKLFSSVDGIKYKRLGAIKPARSTFASDGTIVPYSAQIFSFDLTSMLFFRLLIANCPGQPSFHGCGIGEVAFSAAPPGPVDTTPVPLPPTLQLLASAFGILVWFGRRRKLCN